MVDIAIVVFYLVLMLLIGAYYGRNISSISDYLVSKREFSDKTMVATLFATVIGAGSTCGIVSNVFSSGLIFMFAFYGAALNKFLVAKYVAPKIKSRGNDISIGDIFFREYGTVGRIVIGISIFFVSVVTLGQQVFAVGLIFEYFFNIRFVFGVILGFGTLVIYSAFGGIRSVVKTDVIQFICITAFVPIIALIVL